MWKARTELKAPKAAPSREWIETFRGTGQSHGAEAEKLPELCVGLLRSFILP